ncbi:MAG: bifunctional hydroxymethylpyrimidine kinase/phosphomethylpyrimidine kinase [Planctomycetes bacterium]|nr:bifunctional hydroxymethylpyrimidine kinase/phosphomethylpyrimidine kinase [Planctomycetota bacterium]
MNRAAAVPSAADTFWAADLDLAAACRRHPFVRGLADGSLPRWRYRDYIAQDAFFLRAFAAAYDLAAQRCRDDAGRRLYGELAQGVADELRLHARTAAQFDLDLANVNPSGATSAYTDFLLATAATQPEACTAAAMLPCLRLYAWLGEGLLPDLVPTSPWADWVRTYADPGFARLWQLLAPRLETTAVPRAELATVHRRAMQLELRFFAAAWGGAAPGTPPVALTIAGSDPSGGAGIQADLKTFHRAGVYGQAVLTLLTAQNTRGVQGVFVQPVDVVRAQLRSVLADLGAAAAKTGALGSPAVAEAVAEELARGTRPRLVVDPVLVSKHGHRLADDGVAATMLRRLLPLAELVTPNRFEAAQLGGVEVVDRAAAERAASRIRESGVRAVLVKDVPGLGGDLLVDEAGSRPFERPHVATRHRHGSGCTFSAALTARLACGDTLDEAVDVARDLIVRALASAPQLGDVGPVNHWA